MAQTAKNRITTPTLSPAMRKMTADMMRFSVSIANANDNISGAFHRIKDDPLQHMLKFKTILVGFENKLRATTSRMLSALGPAATAVAWTTRAAAWMPAALISIPLPGLGSFFSIAATAGAFGVVGATFIGRMLWDSMVRMGDAMLTDRFVALSSFSTVGGTRAFRLAFMGLPGDPDAILNNLATARTQRDSAAARSLRVLGVRAAGNNAAMAVAAIQAVTRFAKTTSPEIVLLMARAYGIDSWLSDETLAALIDIDETEIKALSDRFSEDTKALELSAKAQRGLIDFTVYHSRMWAQLENIIGEVLGRPGVLDAVVRLTGSFVRLFEKLANAYATHLSLKKLTDAVKWLGDLFNPANFPDLKFPSSRNRFTTPQPNISPSIVGPPLDLSGAIAPSPIGTRSFNWGSWNAPSSIPPSLRRRAETGHWAGRGGISPPQEGISPPQEGISPPQEGISPPQEGKGISPPQEPFTDSLHDARSFLSLISLHRLRPGDVTLMHPEFAKRLAHALQNLQSEGYNVHLLSGVRSPEDFPSLYDALYSSHLYGVAADLEGIGAYGSPQWKHAVQVLEASGLHDPYLGTIMEEREFNHWQLTDFDLIKHPDLARQLQDDKERGDILKMWSDVAPYEPERARQPKVENLSDVDVSWAQINAASLHSGFE